MWWCDPSASNLVSNSILYWSTYTGQAGRDQQVEWTERFREIFAGLTYTGQASRRGGRSRNRADLKDPCIPTQANVVMDEQWVYHEVQDSSLCGQHALNTLLQGNYFTAVDLAGKALSVIDPWVYALQCYTWWSCSHLPVEPPDIAADIDQKERELMLSMGVSTANFPSPPLHLH